MEDLVGIVHSDDDCGLLGIVLSSRIHELEKTIELVEKKKADESVYPSRFNYLARLYDQKEALTVLRISIHKYRIDTYHG